MFLVFFILLPLLNVQGGPVKQSSDKTSSIWQDYKEKNSNYSHLIEYGTESLCFEDDSYNIKEFYDAVVNGINKSVHYNILEILDKKNIEEYDKAIENEFDIPKFCQELRSRVPEEYNEIRELLKTPITCNTICFCKKFLIDNKRPDKGCILLDYLYDKIEIHETEERFNKKKLEDEKLKKSKENKEKNDEGKKKEEVKPAAPSKDEQAIITTENENKQNDKEGKENVVTNVKPPLITKTTEAETEIKEKTPVKENEAVHNELTSQNKPDDENKQNEENKQQPQLKSETKSEDKGIEDAKIQEMDDKISDLEKSTEQDTNLKMNGDDGVALMDNDSELYDNPEDENIQNSDNINNNIPPKAEQSQPFGNNLNDIGFNNQKPIISTNKYYIQEDAGSNFFTYLFTAMFLTIVIYVVYHNKTKILALILEGRRSKNSRTGRRKHTASYSKLDSNLEEAISSPYSGRSSQIIY